MKTSNQKTVLYIVIGVLILAFAYYGYKKYQESNSHIKTPYIEPYQDRHEIHNSDSAADSPHGKAKYKLYYFRNKKCPACTAFEPTWKELKYRITHPEIKLITIDSSDPRNESLLFYYNISATPTIILSTPKGSVEFEQARTLENLEQFVRANTE